MALLWLSIIQGLVISRGYTTGDTSCTYMSCLLHTIVPKYKEMIHNMFSGRLYVDRKQHVN